jgi:hypothetical protein
MKKNIFKNQVVIIALNPILLSCCYDCNKNKKDRNNFEVTKNDSRFIF